MPIKVLHIIGVLRFGGAQMIVKHCVEHRDVDKIKTYVYSLRSEKNSIIIDGEVISIYNRNYDPRKFWAILRLCRERQIDIIHAHLHKPIIAALLASFFRDVRVVVHEHGPIFRRGVQYWLYRRLLRLLRGRAAAVIAVSQATAGRLAHAARIDPARIRVIRNAVDFAAFSPRREAREKVRRQWGILEDKVVVGFVGRLDYVKGVDLLIEAFALLLQRSDRYFLLLVGAGPQRQELEELARRRGIAESVRFAGFCEEASQAMQAFDIGVVPSRQEALGIAALEMMRMKIPLVCSGVEGLGEIAIHEETALVPAENNPPEIARGVERLAGDGELQKRLTEAAYRFTKHFGIAEYVKAVEQVYREVLGQESL